MVEIRVDRRVLTMLLVLLGIGVPLVIGLMLGGAFTSDTPEAAIGTTVAAPAQGAAQPSPQQIVPDPLGTELPPDVAAAVPRAQLADTLAKLGDPGVLIVDARTEGEYTTSHIPGAISMPVDQVETRLAELPRDKEIIFYCA